MTIHHSAPRNITPDAGFLPSQNSSEPISTQQATTAMAIRPAMSKEEFLSIMDAPIAKQIFAEPDIAKAVTSFSAEQKAALLHFNGISASSDVEASKNLLHLFAAFHAKDEQQLALYLDKGVSTGVRLDYGLPLYSKANGSGEDIYVCSVKVMLGGHASQDLDIDDKGLQGYVQNSFRIRDLLRNAPNKQPIQPTPGALEYVLSNASAYRDSNNNPVIVFIPGVIDVEGAPVSRLIEQALLNGANVNDVGFFDVPGIVWSAIQADTNAVNLFLSRGAKVNFDKPDSFGNHSVTTWAATTLKAAGDDIAYSARMLSILEVLCAADESLNVPNSLGKQPLDYLPAEFNAAKEHLLAKRTALSTQTTQKY